MLSADLVPHALKNVLDFPLGRLEGVLVVLDHLVEKQQGVVVSLPSQVLGAVIVLLAELFIFHELQVGLSGEDDHFFKLFRGEFRAEHVDIELHL